jgi:cytochrome c biogenesis protein CcmG/thiol:disulfide interchange protein DsbE
VGIAVKDIESDSLAFMEEFGITYPNVMDKGAKIEKAYRTQGVPETFIVDRNGEITQFFYAQPSEFELRQAIEEAMRS